MDSDIATVDARRDVEMGVEMDVAMDVGEDVEAARDAAAIFLGGGGPDVDGPAGVWIAG